MWPASCHPQIMRLSASGTKAKKTSPSRAQVGEVCHPEPIRGGGLEVAADEVRPASRLRVGASGAPRLATPLRADDAVGLHQPLHLAARHLLAGPSQRQPHPPIPVGVVVGRVQLADPGKQPPILDDPRRGLATSALVVRGHRHAQRLRDRLDPEAAAMLIHVPAHVGRSGSSSLAKNTLADVRISFARRSSKFSRRNRLMSSRSWLVGRSGRKSWSASTCRTRLRSVSEWTPRSRATCAIGRPLSSANRTPRSSSSSGDVLDLDTAAKDLLSRGQHPGIDVPASSYVVRVKDRQGRSLKRSARTYEEAKRLKGMLVADIARGTYRALCESPLLADYAREWVATYQGRTSRGLRPATLADYARQLELYVVPDLGRMRLSDIEPRDVRRLAMRLAARGLARNSVRLALAPLKLVLATASMMAS
jgi:integrase-like protein